MFENAAIVAEQKTYKLYESESKAYAYWVEFSVKKDSLVISDYRHGKSVEKSWHDSDIEHFLTLKRPDDVDLFINACCALKGLDYPPHPVSDENIIKILNNVFGGKIGALMDAKEILKNADITHDFQVW